MSFNTSFAQDNTADSNTDSIFDNTSDDQFLVKFPLRTTSLSPAEFKSFQNPAALTGSTVEKPICVIGHDPLSIRWLNTHKNKLIDADAVCFVVNIETKALFDQMQSIAPNLKIAAISADWLNKYYGLTHYPALITTDWVSQ